MSDPSIGSQSGRQNLGASSYSKTAAPVRTPTSPLKPEVPSESTPQTKATPAPEAAQTKQRLTTFLNKLETTWQLFNRGTRESDDGVLPKNKAAYLDEADVPTPESLKKLREQVGSKAYLAKNSSGSPGTGGPKESPFADQSTPKGQASKGGAKLPQGPEEKPATRQPTTGGSKSSAAATARSGATPQPSGSPTSKSFLASTTRFGAQMRTSDATGKPGHPAQAEVLGRQPVFSQSLAQVNPRVTGRHVSGEMPVHSSFLDEKHEQDSGSVSPLQLFWSGGKKKTSPRQKLFSGQSRLSLSAKGGGGKSLATLGNRLSLQPNTTAATASKAEIATRFAGKAIHSLLEKLYDDEDMEELDEEEAVGFLGLILRLGGDFTYEHSTRVLDLAMELADEVGIEDEATRKEIRFGATLRDIGEFDLLLQSGSNGDNKIQDLGDFLGGQDMLRAGLLHDIGKINIPKEILYKPGKLTAEEYEIMKMHPIYGESIVRPIASLRYLCPTIRGHHERWDGKGYPDGLAGEDIPIAARIISVADVFDALSAARPYKAGMEVQKVRTILSEGRETHFDPALVDSFLAIIERRYPEV